MMRCIIACAFLLMVACTARKENPVKTKPTAAASAKDTARVAPKDTADAEENGSFRVKFCNKIVGDFDGDGRKETALMTVTDSVFDTAGELEDATTAITFSKRRIPRIVIENDYLGHLQNLGDINHDGRDEIGLYTMHMCNGYFRQYLVYGLRRGKWRDVVKPFILHYDVWLDKGMDFKPVRKLSRKRVYIYTNVWNPKTEWPDFTWVKVRLRK